jgi:hypothetical protein
MGDPTRRELVIGGGAIAAAVAAGRGIGEAEAAPSDAPAPDIGAPGQALTAQGTVSEVVLAGGAAIAKGPPVAGALVSNGRDVVRTDKDGHWSLSVVPGQTLFVIKPAGYRVPVETATKLPLFSYVYEPHGTPAVLGYRYGGLPATGPLPASIDFQLTRLDDPGDYDVLLVTDPQPESTVEIQYLRDDIVAGLVGTTAAFGVNCGDVAFDDLAMYPRINQLFGRAGVPWFNIGGNHDLDYEAPDAARSRDTWKRVFGAPYYAHEHGKALFIMLDNVDYAGAASAEGRRNGRGTYRGRFSDDQLTFVKNLLAATPPDRLLVFFMHIPLVTYLDPENPANNTANAADLLRLIGERPSVSFAGHTHSTEHHYLGAAQGGSDEAPHHHHVLTAASGSWWSGPPDTRGIACADSWDGTPNGHHVLSVRGASYTTRYVPAHEPAERQMRISLETQAHQDDREMMGEVSQLTLLRGPVTSAQSAATRVLVNLFDGGPRSQVSLTIGDGLAVPMTRVRRPDPFVVQLYGRHPGTIKKWVAPQACSHLWQASLPGGLAPGAYTLKATAQDEYGRTHVDAMVLEVV